MAAHRIPYVATATIAYPEDLIRKVLKAKTIKGTRFFNLLAPCPTGWRFPTELSVKLARMAVESRVFPLLEVEDGVRWTVQQPQQGTSVQQAPALTAWVALQASARVQELEPGWHRLGFSSALAPFLGPTSPYLSATA